MDLAIHASKGNPTPYMIQLDALRALAVFGVLVHHFLPGSFLSRVLNWGQLGVQLFFLLSGYLITGILLRCRERVELNKQDTWFTLRRFYIRRFLRLIPIYYLVLIITALLNFEPVRRSLVWHLTYTSNIYFSILNRWDGCVSHFWSLSVEEQFYLFWPFIIMLAPKKYLHSILFIAVFIGPISRFLCIAAGLNTYWRWTMLFTNLDLLAMGAVLAFYNQNLEWKKRYKYKAYLCKFGFWIGIPLLAAFTIINYRYPHHVVLKIFYQSTMSLCFVWLVNSASQGFSGAIGSVLEFKLLTYLGKISYGIYVYHNFVPTIIRHIFRAMGLSISKSVHIQFILFTIVTLLISAISWHLIEKPINNLKEHFGYINRQSNE